MTLLCNNCDMHYHGAKPIGWHGVKRVRTVKAAQSPPEDAWLFGESDEWWTHEGWCPDCVTEKKCECAECLAVVTQKELFST